MLLARLGRRRAPHPPAPDAPATPKAIPQAAPSAPAAAMSKNAPLWLQLAEVTKRFDKGEGLSLTALKHISLALHPDEHLIALIGPDGSGKSTLLKILAGHLAPDEGGYYLTLSPERPVQAADIGYMSQTLGLYEDLTVGANLHLFAQLRDLSADTIKGALGAKADLAARPTLLLEQYLDDLLTQVGLIKFKDYRAGSLSGGMKQKLALTCALSAQPKLLLLDEPTVGVDPISRRELWAIIHEYTARTNSYCIFSSLYLEEADHSDRTIFIKDGALIFAGRSDELKTQVQAQCFKLSLLGAHSYQQVARNLMCHLEYSATIVDLCPRLGRIDLLTQPGTTLDQLQSDLKALLQHACPELTSGDYELTARAPILEDAYINLTGTGSAQRANSSAQAPAAAAAPVSTVSPAAAPDPAPQARLSANRAPDNGEARGATSDAASIHASGAASGEAHSEVIIDVQGIKKQFGNFTAVHDSNFKVYRGEIFGLLGPNGAGKTTTFRMICALLNPSAGKILIEGMSLSDAKSSVRATIGYVAQKFCLYRNLTVQQNLKYFGQSYGMTGEYLSERMEAMLTTFNLKPYLHESAINLPFGVQRSLSMACALIHEPSILFLDEATSGADPASRRSFWAMIARLALQGTTIIVTTHFMEEAEYCDRFLIQDQGQILILGRPDDICGHGAERISIEEAFVNCVNARRQAAAPAPGGSHGTK